MGILPDSVCEERFAIVMELRPVPIGHDTEIGPLGIHTHDPAIAAAKKMKLHTTIQGWWSAEMGLKSDVTGTFEDVCMRPAFRAVTRMSPVGANNAVLAR